MREVQVPSYRVRQAAEDAGPRRLFLVAGGIAGLLAAGGLVGWAVTRYTDKTIPVIEADARPMKIRPEDRGGLRVANQDEIIFERRNIPGGYEPTGRLGPAAEAPNLDALRAATAPPSNTAPQAPTALQAGAPPAATPEAEEAVVAAVPAAAAPATVASSSPAATAQPAPATLSAAPMPAKPAVTPPVATPASSPMRVAGGVLVQLGALDSEEGARTEWDRLERRAPELMQGRKPHIIRFERDGKPTMWRLRTGGFETRDAASSFCETMKSRGGACAVIGG